MIINLFLFKDKQKNQKLNNNQKLIIKKQLLSKFKQKEILR